MAEIVGGVARPVAGAPAVGRTGSRGFGRTIALAGAALLLGAVLAVALLVKPSPAPAAFSAAEIGRAHLLWLSDEHAASGSLGAAAAARLTWLRGEKASYVQGGGASADPAWQASRSFRLEEEGYAR